jgi:hypothetical protein
MFANYLEYVFAATKEQTLFTAMGREVTEFEEQIRSLKDLLDQIS